MVQSCSWVVYNQKGIQKHDMADHSWLTTIRFLLVKSFSSLSPWVFEVWRCWNDCTLTSDRTRTSLSFKKLRRKHCCSCWSRIQVQCWERARNETCHPLKQKTENRVEWKNMEELWTSLNHRWAQRKSTELGTFWFWREGTVAAAGCRNICQSQVLKTPKTGDTPQSGYDEDHREKEFKMVQALLKDVEPWICQDFAAVLALEAQHAKMAVSSGEALLQRLQDLAKTESKSALRVEPDGSKEPILVFADIWHQFQVFGCFHWRIKCRKVAILFQTFVALEPFACV